MMRLLVPAAVLAVEVVPGSNAMDIIGPVLQSLHARHGVLWRAVPYGEGGVLAMTPPGGNWYGRLPAGERAGVAVWNGFLLLHTSASGLERLLEHFRRDAAADPLPMVADTGWYLHLDGPSASEVLRMGVSSYALWQVMEGQVRDHARESYLQRLADTVAAYSHARIVIRMLPDGYGGELVLSLKEDGRP